MAFDAENHSQRGGYFDASDSNRQIPVYSSRYPPEPRDDSFPRQPSTNSQQQYPTSNMTTGPDRSSAGDGDGVSPELVAAITEKVKKELLEHLKQTSSIDEQQKAPQMERAPSDKTSSSSSPPPHHRGVYTPPSPSQTTRPSFSSPPMGPSRSPPASPLEKPTNVRFSDMDREWEQERERDRPTRPAGPPRTYSTVELSTIDQKWGRLFDKDGSPTQRLGQFLRGLANHIIEDFAPKKSIVITPSKMLQYYANHSLEKEPQSYLAIFRANSNEQISLLYQDLRCEHHLVQETTRDEPTVPGLTPVGFAQWMTMHILAYPEEEAKRLDKVVLAMPIDADGQMVDGKPERLPKQISRHLLPDRESRKTRKLLEDAIKGFFEDLETAPKKKTKLSNPLLSQQTGRSEPQPKPAETERASQTTPKAKPIERESKPIERERMPYAGAPSATSESSAGDDTTPAPKIERERKPYSAQPGNGKTYTENLNPPTASSSRLGRANSTSHGERPLRSRSRESQHERKQSSTSQDYKPPPQAGGQTGSRRSRSPAMKSYSNSTPVNINSSTAYDSSKYIPSFTGPSSYGSSSSFPPPPPPPSDHRELRDRTRTREDRFAPRRRDTEDEHLNNEFISPRDAERWDRIQDARGERADRTAYEPRQRERDRDLRSTVSADERYDDWCRDHGRDGKYEHRYSQGY